MAPREKKLKNQELSRSKWGAFGDIWIIVCPKVVLGEFEVVAFHSSLEWPSRRQNVKKYAYKASAESLWS